MGWKGGGQEHSPLPIEAQRSLRQPIPARPHSTPPPSRGALSANQSPPAAPRGAQSAPPYLRQGLHPLPPNSDNPPSAPNQWEAGSD